MTTQQTYQTSPSRSHQNPVEFSEFERKEEDEGCCNCCIAPCKLIGLLFFLPCCIYSCCQARSNFQKEAKEFKNKHSDTISVEPGMRVSKQPTVSSASEMVSKLQNISAPKYKVEPAPDKVKVIDKDESGSSKGGNGIENKEYLELETLPSTKN